MTADDFEALSKTPEVKTIYRELPPNPQWRSDAMKFEPNFKGIEWKGPNGAVSIL